MKPYSSGVHSRTVKLGYGAVAGTHSVVHVRHTLTASVHYLVSNPQDDTQGWGAAATAAPTATTATTTKTTKTTKTQSLVRSAAHKFADTRRRRPSTAAASLHPSTSTTTATEEPVASSSHAARPRASSARGPGAEPTAAKRASSARVTTAVRDRAEPVRVPSLSLHHHRVQRSVCQRRRPRAGSDARIHNGSFMGCLLGVCEQ